MGRSVPRRMGRAGRERAKTSRLEASAMPIDPERASQMRDKILEHLEAALAIADETQDEDAGHRYRVHQRRSSISSGLAISNARLPTIASCSHSGEPIWHFLGKDQRFLFGDRQQNRICNCYS